MDLPGHTLYFLFVGISADMMRQFGLTRCPGYAELFPAHERNTGYFPIQFSPSDQPYAYLFHYPNETVGRDGKKVPSEPIENRIVELGLPSLDSADGNDATPAPGWQLNRVRSDRDEDLQRGRLFGNNFKTA